MELSQSDITLLADLGRKLARAPATEVVAAEIHRNLQQIARFSEVRVVAAVQPSGWREWTAGSRVAGVRESDTLPLPPAKGTIAYFDPERRDAGFLWISTTEKRCCQALQLVASHAETAIMLNAALQRSQRSTIQEGELVRETMRSRDEERRRIAQELHDDLGQSLASLKLNLKWAEDVVRAGDGLDKAAAELSAARESVGAILGKVCDLSHTLYPSILESLGLTAAIKELLYQATRRADIEAHCDATGLEKPLPREVAVGLYRCCQEAVNNAVRHSGASRITVNIGYAAAELRITVEDNGRGFDPGNHHKNGGPLMSSGFWTIRQRVADLGGAFRVCTALGKGTAVEISVPTHLRVINGSKNKAVNR